MWWNKPKVEPVDFYCTDKQLAKLVTDLDAAWDYGLYDIDAMIHGLFFRLKYVHELDLFRVYLYPEQVEMLDKYIPSASIKERYGTQ